MKRLRNILMLIAVILAVLLAFPNLLSCKHIALGEAQVAAPCWSYEGHYFSEPIPGVYWERPELPKHEAVWSE